MDPALAGFLMVAAFTALILSGRLAPAPALVLTPLVFGLLAGHGTDLGPMAVVAVSAAEAGSAAAAAAVAAAALLGLQRQ